MNPFQSNYPFTATRAPFRDYNNFPPFFAPIPFARMAPYHDWQISSAYSVPPVMFTCACFNPRTTALAIARLEFLFSIASVFGDGKIRGLMSKSLWVRLEDVIYDDRLICYGATTLECVQILIHKSITENRFTNLELDSTGLLVRPRWGKRSQLTIKITFADTYNKSLKKKKMLDTGRQIIHQALVSAQSSQQLAHEPEHVRMDMVGYDLNGNFTAGFNAPGIPSLLEPFLKDNSDEQISVVVVESLDAPIFC